jgi:hypothetical protein
MIQGAGTASPPAEQRVDRSGAQFREPPLDPMLRSGIVELFGNCGGTHPQVDRLRVGAKRGRTFRGPLEVFERMWKITPAPVVEGQPFELVVE